MSAVVLAQFSDIFETCCSRRKFGKLVEKKRLSLEEVTKQLVKIQKTEKIKCVL